MVTIPIYVWESDKGHAVEVWRHIPYRGEKPRQDEGAKKGHVYTRCIAGVTSTQKDYAKPILSDAMAVNAEDVAEHRKAHPTVPIMKDGRIGPIRNHHEHKRIMKELGFVDRSR